VLTSAGLAIVGSEDWVLYASSFGDDGPALSLPGSNPAAFWPQPRHDAGQTGRALAGGGEESVAYLIQRELAASPLLSQKEGVIAALRAHFAGEAFLPLSASQLEELLVLLAQEGAVSVVYVGEQALTDYPELRAAACELLGSLGTGGARAALITVVEKDPRSEVQSKAAEALGNVAYDPDGRSSRALRRLAERRASDERLLLVVVGALREVAAAGGPELGLGNAAEGFAEELALAARPAWEALVSLVTERYPERVRVAARRALADLVAEVRR
jgi:hypothetical protein